MKISIFILILLVTNIRCVVSLQTCIGEGELIFYNYYADGVIVKVIPYESIFSGPKTNNGLNHKYSLRTCFRTTDAGTNWTHVVGGSRIMSLLPAGIFPPICTTNSGGYAVFDWDDGNNYKWDSYFHPEVCVGSVSYGLWKVEFWWTPTEDSPSDQINSCWIDYRDWRAPEGCREYNVNNDLFVKLTSDNKIYFYWSNSFEQQSEGAWVSITSSHVPNRTIQWWRQVISEQGQIYQCPNGQDKGNFLTSSTDSGYWLNFPIDAHKLNSSYIHSYPEYLNMNLSVANGHNAILKTGETMYIKNGATFSILQNAIFTLKNNSVLHVKSGGLFCNYGIINREGNAVIKYERGINGHCITPQNAQFKGVNVIFEDSAIVEFPDSTTITFDSSAVFTMMPHSELRLGKNTKLVFLNGSRINCNNAKITSLDSTNTWDGIYLDGLAYDTLKNCTFQNALNGINITDNYSLFSTPGAVEISNCTFKNSTSTELLNYVYINNSYNVLVKGCNAVKTGSAGFTAGIIAEYCSAGGIVICDNNINYVNTGISLLQSSEYIARNVITGYSNTGTGIYLDNSNGTIEYNTVNNFQKSIYGSYSSPYLLKNSLIDAYITNIDLVNSSMPVMKPVISSSTLRWLGGNNNITGYPTNSGIRFADCYPLIDSGYNKIVVNGSDYLNGNFTLLFTTVPATLNYWYDDPPISSLFDITEGNADYSNPFNGTSLPATDGTELNSIGWGLYDSVFTKEMGDNPTPEDLFTQAYTEEMSGNYTDAVTHYKEVVSSYKTSEYAPVSLARIFNCLEKSRANLSQYYTIQSYYTNIQNNSAYPNATRELSEDFKIKSKVKQFNIEEAITDYDNIYQNNQNNAKGLHALINKFSLQRMTQGDVLNGSMINYTEHKLGILSLITGKDLKNTNIAINNQPSQFRLHQNYPNPFNPTTSIKFDIPLLRGVSEGRGVFITIKVYDILGKEVFSFNEYKLAGSYEVKFDGSNLASGMYFYSFEANGYKDVKKMVLLK